MEYAFANVSFDKTPFLVAEMALQNGGDVMASARERNSGVTAEWIRENMAYEPETGAFLWKVRGMGRVMGKVLGTRHWNDYVSIKVCQTAHYAHRLAWLYVYGEWPNGLLDHVDGNPANNAIKNLRIATAAQNAARRKTTRTIAPSRGVFPHGPGFVARLHHGGKRHYLGYFSTAAEAKAAYEAKAKEIHGEFAHVEPNANAELIGDNPCRDGLLTANLGFGA